MNNWPPKPTDFGVGDPHNLQNGWIYTLDNRRLYTAKEAGMKHIPVNIASEPVIYNQRWKFTTPNKGVSIVVR